jgi:signal transduction histidine kinase
MPNTDGKGVDGRRGPSIRRSLYLLVAIPLLTVIGLYAFVLYTTVGDAINLDRAPALINATSVPAAQFNINIQNERKASMVYLAAPTAANRAQLQAAQNTTTQAFPAFQAKMNSSATTNAATPAELSAIRQMLSSIQGLAKIRPAILAHAISPTDVFGAFSNVLSQELQLFVNENASLTNADAATASLAIINSTESGEFMSQEDALVSSALAARLLPHATRIQVTQLAGARQAMLQATTSRLDPSDLAVFNGQLNKYAPAAVQSSLTQLENAVAADSTTFPPFTAASWDPVLKAMSAGIFSAGVNTVENQVQHDHTITSAAWRRVALSGGLGLLGLILSVLLSVLIGRRIVRRLDRLRGSVETLANEELPDVVTRLRRGEDVPVDQLDSTTSDLGNDEIGRVGRAFDAARRTAVEAAVGEARMRRGVNDVFRNLARRNQSLLHRELTVLDGMERRTTDPETLEDLFRLDHLTTRMRRHSEGLIILSGAAPGRGWVHPVRMIDVLRAAAAEVEDYSRVTVTTPSQAALTGPAVADVIHLLAELIENATSLSPPYTPVRVSGDMVASGFAVEIEDRGLGMSEARYAELNQRLAEPPEFDVFNSEQLGLFVVGQLAKRHGIRVTLRPSPYGGTSAIALIPASLVGNDDGFVEGLPAGTSAAATAWPAQEIPAELTGAPAWGALPRGTGSGDVTGTAPAAPSAPVPAGAPNGFSPVNGVNGVNGPSLPRDNGESNGAGTRSEPPAGSFESYSRPGFGTAPYESAGHGNPGSSSFGFTTPPGEQSPFGRPAEPPFGSADDGPTETGLPWPYDKPGPGGTPSFTPAEPAGSEPGRPPFPPAPFPGAEPPYAPPSYPAAEPSDPDQAEPSDPDQAEPSDPAADAPLPQRSDSRPSLPLRRRSQSRPSGTSGPEPQFTAEPPMFSPEPASFSPQPPQFGSEPPTFSPQPPQFGAEPPTFTPQPPQFGSEPPTFTPQPAAFGAEPAALAAEPPAIGAEQPGHATESPASAAEPPGLAAESSGPAAEPSGPVAPVTDQFEPDAPADADADESYKGLPRRVRQANLAPQLRDAPAETGRPAARSADNVVNRSPDDIRSALSAMQRGWQQGREDAYGEYSGTGGVASGHQPYGAETESTGSSDDDGHGGNDES